MVYLGPIQPRPQALNLPSRPAEVPAVNPYANEKHLDQPSAGLAFVGPPGGIERRKQDRRRNRANPILETRDCRDRRKNPQPAIDISI